MLRILQKARINILNEVKYYASYSTKPAIKNEKDYEKVLKEFERISNITRKTRVKKPQKPPFVKNLFLGIFDTDLLTYPELSNEDVANLENAVKEAQTVVENPQINQATTISKQLLGKLSSQKLLGLQASQLMDGREVGVTETCRLFEVLSDLNLKNNIIFNESLGILTLTKYANDKLKRKYLQKLIHGENLSAFCYIEPLETNIDVFKKTASLSGNGKSYVLNGKQKFLINGSSADFYIVIAHTDTIVKGEHSEQQLTAFVVERDFGGITSTRFKTIDSNLEVSDVKFENTIIPAENIVGNLNEGLDILTNITMESRLNVGVICSNINKKLINTAADQLIKNSKEPYLLYETDAIRSQIGQWATSLYVIDSMVYLTAGLLDNYENQDCELECAITKVFSSEQTVLNTISCLNQIGHESLIESNWCNKLHKEALTQISLIDPNDNLKNFIALYGLRHAGHELNQLIKKLRNPLYNAHFIMKRLWTNRGQASDKPKLNLYLHHYLHPSFFIASNHLEYSVLRLQFATEMVFTRYGQDIINQHMDLKRLADIIIDIYAMTCCISRASRSYCIGLQHAEHEMVLATTFCNAALQRVKKNIEEILDGVHHTNDENYRTISNRLFHFKKYYPVHPLTRNF